MGYYKATAEEDPEDKNLIHIMVEIGEDCYYSTVTREEWESKFPLTPPVAR